MSDEYPGIPEEGETIQDHGSIDMGDGGGGPPNNPPDGGGGGGGNDPPRERIGHYRVNPKTEYVNGVVYWRVSPADSKDPKDSFLMLPADKGAIEKPKLMNAVNAAMGEPVLFRMVMAPDKKDEAGIVTPAEHWVLVEAPLAAIDQKRLPNEILAEQSGKYFIREMILDRKTGDKTYRISPNDKNAKEQEMLVRVSGSHPDRNLINRAMKNSPGSSMDLELVQTEMDKGTNRWEIMDVEVGPPKERIVKRPDPENKERKLDAFEWTDNLDNKVDNWMAFDYMGKAAKHFAVATKGPVSPEMNAAAKQQFVEIMTSASAARGAPMSPHDIEQQWLAHSSAKNSINGILAGEERPDGVAARVCYGVESPFERQVDINEGTLDGLAARASNYSFQKSLHSSMVAQVANPQLDESGKVVGSGYEDAQTALVESRALFAENPKLTSYDMNVRDQELSEMAVAKMQRLLMSATGSKFVAPSVDDVRYAGPDAATPTHAAKLRAELEHAHLIPSAEVIAADPSKMADAMEKLLQGSQQYTARSQHAIMTGEGGILNEQDEHAIRPPFSRKDPAVINKKTADKVNDIAAKTHETAGDFVTKGAAFMDEMETMQILG